MTCSLIPRREAGDVWCLPPVWNLRAVIWFHFTIPSLVLLTFSPDFFSKKILQYFWSVGRVFLYGSCFAAVELSWSVVCTACCHTALVFAVMHSPSFTFNECLHCVLTFVFYQDSVDFTAPLLFELLKGCGPTWWCAEKKKGKLYHKFCTTRDICFCIFPPPLSFMDMCSYIFLPDNKF